ncbi:TPA: hypothetical protein EYP12_08040 [Candidatus Bipolaricaulota bacterium]|nr:hypothetical protein [Candidatus Bipolaricaulota bacterium]HIQ05111.1 hypothetical protein [Anaerolineae bacterium]
MAEKRSDDQQTHISDELLSAYLDGEVTAVERAQIERGLVTDPQLAWRLEMLRQTVSLLNGLPRVPVPRAFTLSERDVHPSEPSGIRRSWQHWLRHALPIYVRGLTVATVILLLLVVAGDVWIQVSTGGFQPFPQRAAAPAAMPAEPQKLVAAPSVSKGPVAEKRVVETVVVEREVSATPVVEERAKEALPSLKPPGAKPTPSVKVAEATEVERMEAAPERPAPAPSLTQGSGGTVPAVTPSPVPTALVRAPQPVPTQQLPVGRAVSVPPEVQMQQPTMTSTLGVPLRPSSAPTTGALPSPAQEDQGVRLLTAETAQQPAATLARLLSVRRFLRGAEIFLALALALLLFVRWRLPLSH